ncbi:hypothetical protein O6H91_Y016500 [Diphasiastrum complanatum]|nr:hypothetical protein O6H91_Y068000 [Diphasiastrum complanatum]KAJ7298108.1 hypothetical protein O6H91_Y016500 [Diphasiastrum complanatum]
MDDHDVLLNIFQHVKDKYDKQAWRLVCRHFYRLEAISRTGIRLSNATLLTKILERYPNIMYLDLSSCVQINDQCIAFTAEYLGARLLSINLTRTRGFSDAALDIIARKCVRLWDVDLSYCSSVRDFGVVALSQLSNLQCLKLIGCYEISDTALVYLGARCKKLSLLNLRGCLGISDIAIVSLAANCKQLHTLDVSYTVVTDEGLAAVASLSYLENLHLVSCNNISDRGLDYLRAGCKMLLKLDLSRCPNVSDVGLSNLSTGSSLQQLMLSYCSPMTAKVLATFHMFDYLQFIKLDGCEVSRNGLCFLGNGCNKLKGLSLSKCKGVDDLGIAAITRGCARSLQAIDLTCCRQLSDHTLFSIGACCKGLVSLKMEACNLISETGLAFLGQGCPHLQEIDLTECDINDKGLMSLLHCTKLTSLRIGLCQNISDRGLAQLGANCYSLREVDLYRSWGIGDFGVAALCKGCKELRVLNLSYCMNITDRAMQSISLLGELEQLELRGCALISSAGISYVAAGCTRLVKLEIKRCTGIDDDGVLAISQFCVNLRKINLSYCAVTNAGLKSIGKMNYIEKLKLVHVQIVILNECNIAATLLHCGSLKKVKLSSYLRPFLSWNAINGLERRGCRFQWME